MIAIAVPLESRNQFSKERAMVLHETELMMTDSKRLRVRSYEPVGIPAERTLFIVHGVCEHGGRYEHIARKLADRGWRVIVPDQRGHGLSQGTPTHVRSFSKYVADLHTIRSHFDAPAQQTAVLGHSMGGLVAIRYAQQYSDQLAAVVLCSPLLRVSVPIPAAKLIAGWVLSHTYPRFRFQSGVDPEWTSHNEEVLIQRKIDPLFRTSVTARWFFATRRAIRAAWAETSSIRVPVMMLQSGEDYLVDANAAEPWLQSLPEADHKFHLFPGHFHELLNEPDWEETLRKIGNWLDERVCPPQPVYQQLIA